MLRELRREFFAKYTDKRFFQERPMLIQSITWPARWMNDRGVKARPEIYRGILRTVIKTIRERGNVSRIRRFSVYFLHSVQEHMKHHGDQYYYTAKAARPIADVLPAAIRASNRPGRDPDPTTSTLSELNRVLRSTGGRRRRDSVGQLDLLTALHPPLSSKAL
jgi:hypothetical protein